MACKPSRYLVFICIAYLLVNLKVLGQSTAAEPPFSVVYHQWNSKDGLPSWKIEAFLHDSRGLMWMNTGLSIYNFDGQVFRQAARLSAKDQATYIVGLNEDLHGNIWIIRQATNFCTIDVLLYTTGEVMPLHEYLSMPQPIRIPLHHGLVVTYSLGDSLWIGSTQQGFLYDGRWRQVLHRAKDDGFHQWLPAKEGFWVVENQSRLIRLIDSEGQQCDLFNVGQARTFASVWIDRDLNLWTGVLGKNGVDIDEYIRLSASTGSISQWRQRTAPKPAWQHRRLQSHEQRLLAYGLHKYAEDDTLFLGTTQQPKAINLTREYPEVAISGNHYIDRTGALWCVNPNNLIRMEFKRPLPFRRYLSEIKPVYSTRGIARFGNELVVNTYAGAKRVNPVTGTINTFLFPSNNQGLALRADDKGLWIGSHNSFIIRQFSDGRQLNYPMSTPHFSLVYCFLKSGSTLFIGTNHGLHYISAEADRAMLSAFSGGQVYALHENASGLWAGTRQGLLLLDKSGRIINTVVKPAGDIHFQYITYIYEAPSGELWLSTQGGGLLYWNPKTGAINQYTTHQGLSHDNIHAIYPDSMGYLWMPSDYGLMRFHPASKTVYTFFKGDGLADDEFNQMSHFRDRDGQLFFGGINGITAFYPHEISPAIDKSHRLLLVEASAFDIQSGKLIVRSQNAATTSSIDIYPSDAYINIRLSPLIFEENKKYYYEWKIEGLHEHWIRQRSPYIRLSKLAYGKQQLLARLGMQGNPVASPVFRLPINVVRPYYLRLPFILLAAGLLVAIVASFSHWRNRRLISNNLLLEQEVRSRTYQIEQDKEIIAQQASDLRALDEMKSRFFTNVTHELRTPLTLILGPVDHLINHKTSSDKTSAYLLTIQRNARKLYNLVDELLDLSKMESDKLVLDEKPSMLLPFLKRILTAFAPFAEQQDISLRTDYQFPENLCIHMDLAKWEKILNNLLSNALKFTPQGGSIVLFAQLNDNLLTIGVSDSGCGIPAEDLPFIFDRYFQTRQADASLKGGTGIGLSLCKEYARLFGADMAVRSSPGKGSTFSVSFCPKIIQDQPVPAAVHENDGHPPFVPQRQSHTADNDRHTLLLVEDDVDMMDYLYSILQNDYHVLAAANGQIALQLLNTHEIDLVLSDVMMPQIDGFQLLKKSKEINISLPFILLTARMATDDRLQALQLGVDDYLTKPFVEEELQARLRNLLARHDARKKLHASRFLQDIASQQHTPAAALEVSPSFDQQWLSALDLIILENIGHSNFNIANLADKMNTSERNIYYKVRSFTGLTPNQYITEARLVRARQLLESKTFPTVAEVCFAVGLTSPQHFSRIFKNRFGKLPSDLLKSLPTAAK